MSGYSIHLGVVSLIPQSIIYLTRKQNLNLKTRELYTMMHDILLITRIHKTHHGVAW